MTFRRRVYQALNYKAGSGQLAFAVMLTVQSLIFLNVIAVILESMPEARASLPLGTFYWIEACSIAVFSVEYLLRLWSSPEDKQHGSATRSRLAFAFSALGLVDLLAILPFFLTFVSIDLRILRMLRMVRIFRLGKLGRYSRAMQVLGRVLRQRRDELLSAVMLFVIATTVAASLAYFAESELQPDKFSSIPAAMWWAVITLTTVGYGDVVPVSLWGKIVAMLASIVGVSLFALLAGILVMGFVDEIRADLAGKNAEL